jgi:predicted RNase H-like HicB family nuclease
MPSFAQPSRVVPRASVEEAMENIRDAIREYLAAIKEALPAADVREVEVTV